MKVKGFKYSVGLLERIGMRACLFYFMFSSERPFMIVLGVRGIQVLVTLEFLQQETTERRKI